MSDEQEREAQLATRPGAGMGYILPAESHNYNSPYRRTSRLAEGKIAPNRRARGTSGARATRERQLRWWRAGIPSARRRNPWWTADPFSRQGFSRSGRGYRMRASSSPARGATIER